ncbi:MAG TPA: enoyl-CoA hydratase/isomerase family protein [Ramlibacter sp.]|nr:enoyl-CoA hydratase/isomerase family protein [Ramlibacter sp.]
MSEELVRLEDFGSYAVITLNRPEKRNAMSSAAQQQLQDILKQCLGRYPAAVITGSGPAFCSGIDLKERRERLESGDAPKEYSRQGHSWVETIEAIRKHPTVFIAAVNGTALGGGISLINVCDLAVCAEDAQIGMPEITFASYPTVAGPTTQLRLLRKHAAWLILTGKRIDGRTAAKWGLVNAAVPLDRVLEEAKALAAHVAQFDPTTLDWCKKALDDIPAQVSDWTSALEYGRVVTSVIQNQVGKDKVTPAKF